MARIEYASGESLQDGANASGDILYQLGVMYATGREVQMNLIEAHKWLNIAAFRGSSDAARYRRELSSEMSPGEIALAQRQAREWISVH
jgi:TPR repeat protein